MALGSKMQNGILSKLIQFLTTIIQIICLIIMLVNFVTVMNYFGASGVKRVTMPEASYYLCLYLFWFLKESEYKNYALASIIFVNVCLIYCIWMGKSSFDYWKWRQEKTGRCSLVWLYITGLVSTKLLKSRPCGKSIVEFCTSALLRALKINLLSPEKHRWSRFQKCKSPLENLHMVWTFKFHVYGIAQWKMESFFSSVSLLRVKFE